MYSSYGHYFFLFLRWLNTIARGARWPSMPGFCAAAFSFAAGIVFAGFNSQGVGSESAGMLHGTCVIQFFFCFFTEMHRLVKVCDVLKMWDLE